MTRARLRYCRFRDCTQLASPAHLHCAFHAAALGEESTKRRLHHSGALRAAHRTLELAEKQGDDPDRYARALAGVLRQWFGPEAVLVAQSTTRHLGGS